VVLPSTAKFVHTIGFMYGEVIRRFTEFLARPHTCLLVSGYGFQDEHINRILVSALQNPTLQLVIYLPELHRTGLFPDLQIAEENKETAVPVNAHLRRL